MWSGCPRFYLTVAPGVAPDWHSPLPPDHSLPLQAFDSWTSGEPSRVGTRVGDKRRGVDGGWRNREWGSEADDGGGLEVDAHVERAGAG